MRLFRFTSSLVYCFLLLLFVFFAGLQSHLLVSAAGTAGNTKERTYQLQHTFGGDGSSGNAQPWEDCGVLKTRVTEKTAGGKDSKKKVVFHGIKVAYNELTKKSKSELIEAAKVVDGYYRLRISTTPLEDVESSSSLEYVLTSVKASCLVAAAYQDHFNLHFDEDGKTLVSADHTVSSNAAADCSSATNPQWMQSEASDVPDKLGPTTNSVKFSKVAPALSTISRRSRSNDSDMEDDEGGDGELRYEDDEDEEGGARKPPVDERTWLQKNWMMVLAGGMMVVNLLGSASQPQQRRGGGGGGAQQRR